MQIKWENSDLWAGRRIHKDAECIIGGNPFDHRATAVVMVLETGRIMIIGTREEVADYLTQNQYLPEPERKT